MTSSSSERIPAEHQQGVYDQSPPRESWTGGPPHHLQHGEENKESTLHVCFLRLFFKKEAESVTSVYCCCFKEVDIVSSRAGEQTKPAVERRVSPCPSRGVSSDVLTAAGQESHLSTKRLFLCARVNWRRTHRPAIPAALHAENVECFLAKTAKNSK